MRWCPVWSRLAGGLLTLTLLLAGCTSGGDEGQATAPSAPSPRVERQALANLLALYQEAVIAEDSDRLQALLAPAAVLAQAQTTTVLRQDSTGAVADLAAFQPGQQADRAVVDFCPGIHVSWGTVQSTATAAAVVQYTIVGAVMYHC